MIRHLAWSQTCLLLLSVCPALLPAQTGFTIEQALRQPYTVSVSAAPAGVLFAWVEVAEGRHNLWVGSPGSPARALTHYTEDDGQELRELTWFPDGKTIAFTRGPENGADGKPANPAHSQPPMEVEVWIVATGPADSRTSEPRLVGTGHAPLPSRDGKHLLLVRSGQIWVADLLRGGQPQTGTGRKEGHSSSQSSRAITRDKSSKARVEERGVPQRQLVFDRGSASSLAFSQSGDTLAFISRRDHTHSFLALFDLQHGMLSFPAASTGNDSAPVFSPDGRQLAWLRTPFTDPPEFAANRTSPNPWSIQVLELATGQVHTAFAPAANAPGSVLPHVSSGEPRLWYAAGGQLLFASEADGWLHLYALDPAQPQAAPRLLTPGSFEVEDPALSADGRQLVYAANAAEPADSADRLDADRRHLWSLDLSDRAARPRPLTSGEGLETHPVFAADGSVMAALQSGVRIANHPVTLKAGSAPVPLGAPVASSHIVLGNFVTPQQVLFPSADKLFTLHGQLFLPTTTGSSTTRRPVLLFFHGGPRRQMLLGFPAMEYYARAYTLNQYFASRGFIVLSVNYRRGIGYGLDFREAAHTGADGAAEYNDVLGAVAYLRSRPDVDLARVGLWGGSYGGYLTALGLARNSDLFAAGVDFHGVHDWILEENRADWLRGTAAEQEAIATQAHASSPLADLDRWKSPVLLIHGDNDANVAYPQTPILADALRARGVKTEELIFPDEIHEFLLYRDWLAAYKATAEFLERQLRPER